MPADGGGRGRAVGEAGVYLHHPVSKPMSPPAWCTASTSRSGRRGSDAVTRIVAVPSATAVNVTRAPQFNSLRDIPLCGAKTLFRTLDADTRLTYSPSCDTRCAWPDTGPPADYNTGCPAGNRRESALYTCVLCRNRPGDHYRSRARGGRHERTKSPSLTANRRGGLRRGWLEPGNHPLRESDGGSPLGERRGAAREQVGLDFRRTLWKRTPGFR